MSASGADRATRILGEFAAGASSKSLPPDLFDLARLYVLDAIGSIVVGSTQDWAPGLINYCTASGGGPSAVVGSLKPAIPPLAALANGTMGHGFEIDDVHDESLTHPGIVVVPAALAVAEQRPCSGTEFLTAVIVGYELVGRAGLGVGAVPHMLGGFYPTGTGGVFGATASAGRLLGLDADAMTNALGIAGSFASGLVEYAQTGGVVKWLHAGRAAEGGVTAAHLAESGLTGPPTVLEGKFGFCRTFSKAPELHRLLEGLGTDYKIRSITIKPYACCSDIHPVIDALLELKVNHAPRPDQIEKISIESTTKLLELNNIDGASSMMAAKYSVPFTVAIVLTRDIRDPSVYRAETLRDAPLGSMQKLVEMRATEEFDSTFPYRIGARVTIKLKDGRSLSAVNKGAAGSIHNPLGKAKIQDKFMRLADPILPAGSAKKVMQYVAGLDERSGIDRIAPLLRFDALRHRAPQAASASVTAFKVPVQ